MAVRPFQIFEINFEGETQMGIDSNSKKSKKQPGSLIGAWMVIGVGVGLAIGAALDQKRKKEE
jgi:hypothetical protein